MYPDGDRLSTFLFRHPAGNQFDLNGLIRKLSRLRHHHCGHCNIVVILDLATELPGTLADCEQVESVLLSLFLRSWNAIINARQQCGTITVRTLYKGGKIRLSITDDGRADRRFGTASECFARTPDEDINLTTCAGIVQDQGGELCAWSPSRSPVTTIIMELPAAAPVV